MSNVPITGLPLPPGAAPTVTATRRAPEGNVRQWLDSIGQAAHHAAPPAELASERRRRSSSGTCAWPGPSIAPFHEPPAMRTPEDSPGGHGGSTRACGHAARNGPPEGLVGVGRERLRWHGEWAGEGLRVWLGSDAAGARGAAEVPLEAIVAELRRQLEVRGVRLLSVVCNGREVWTESSPGDLPERYVTTEEP